MLLNAWIQEEIVGAVQELHHEVGNLKDELQNMNKRLDLFIKFQDDSARIASSSSGKAKEAIVLTPMMADSQGNNSTATFSSSRRDFRFQKLKMPVFDGSNPDGWIMKAERYFFLHRFTNEEKLEVTIISFEGDALLWFQWENNKRLVVLWEEMKMMILKQFRNTQSGTFHKQWLALKQEGSICKYQQKFIALSAPLVSDEVSLRNLFNGLRPEIRVEIRIMEPNNLGWAMELAQKIEEKHCVASSLRAGRGNPAPGYGWGLRLTNDLTRGVRTTFRKPLGGGAAICKSNGEVRRLADFEIQKKRCWKIWG